MKEKRLAVSLPGRVVGELRQDRSGLVQWIPDPEWERDGQVPRLGLDFLRRLGPRQHASDVPSWFENLLPERDSQLRRRLCQHHGLREGQSFALLRAVGRDLIGAVEIHDLEPVDDEGQQTAPSHGSLSGAEPKTAPERLSTLTGMQLKFSMSMVNERLVLPARASGAQYIVKLGGRDYEEIASVEDATMTWARLAGFSVPKHAVFPFSKLEGVPEGWVDEQFPAFAIERFDRREDGSKIHQEDLCQALALRPHDKFGDSPDQPVTFEGALRLVVDACGDTDGHEMARRLGFMLATGNTDAHLKNWSLIWGDRPRPTLAPCYDLIATIAWPQFGWKRPDGPSLALHLGGEQLFKRIDAMSLDRVTTKSGLPWAKESILDGIERARSAWPEVRELLPQRMRDPILQHWRAVPVLATTGSLEG